jgi:hypothetical protein
MSDNLGNVWNSFFAQRTKPLQIRFNGTFRAVVVETNDPLRMRRIRFKIPELHDWDLKAEECPWAVTSTDLGTKRCGRFSYPCIGDHVWINFEKNHPYGPIYSGFSDPTRRKYYSLPSIYGVTQTPVDEKSDVTEKVVDYDEDYLPKDERPMSHGWQDRYGHLDIHNSVGFYPIEHDVTLPPAGTDPLTQSEFTQSAKSPEVNDPDSKMMARLTKYGNLILQSDAGYKWKEEFAGDFDEDEKFEIARWLYLQKLLHENKPTGQDQRRITHLTRYGHKFEMRDVGWNKTRTQEYSSEFWAEPKTIGDGEDERWMKLRTKGGHLIELSDIGFDPENDEFIKRKLLDDIEEVYLDKEDQYDKEETEWNKSGDRDMRMLRFVTRSGLKIAMDDRTSHDGGDYRLPASSSDENRKNEELGIGILVKGRATPGTKADEYNSLSGDPRGYYWQFDERPDRNSTTWGTPMGQAIEMDDNEELLTICTRLPDLPTPWKYLSDNEFLEESVESLEPTKNTHHLVIDHGREAIRLKSRAGEGEASRTKKLGEGASGEHAGLEIHDAPSDDPWTEVVDIDKRGIWFSRKEGVGIWRGKEGSNIYLWLDDKKNNIILRNATAGKIQIYCQGNVDIISDKVIGMKANRIEMKANEIRLDAGGSLYTFDSSALRAGKDIHASNVFARFPTAERPKFIAGKGIGQASGGGQPVSNLSIEDLPDRQEPDNRI